MANINKYWLVLEALQLPVVGAPKDLKLSREERLDYNLQELRKTIKITPIKAVSSLINDLKLEHLRDKQKDILRNSGDPELYCLYSLKMLNIIFQNVKFSSEAREDLVSESHKAQIIATLNDVAEYGLQENLHAGFYKDKGAVFKRDAAKTKTNFYYLDFVVEVFASLVYVKPLCVGKSMDDVHLGYMAGVFSLLLAFESGEYKLEKMQSQGLHRKLNKLWLEFSKKCYYRNLMLFYSTLPNDYKPTVHKEMCLKLWSAGGFMALLFAMVESQRNEEQQLDEMVAALVAQPTYSIKAQQSLITQILNFLQASLKNKELLPHMGTGLLCLRKLYDNKLENRDFLVAWLHQQISPLIEVDPENVVAMEWPEFIELVTFLYHTFFTSSVATLPSELLLPYLPVFLEIYSDLLAFEQQEALISQLSFMILRMLNNLSQKDLKNTILYVALQSYPSKWYQKHPSIIVRENALNSQELKLTQTGERASNPNLLPTLVVILKLSSFNLLIYQIFIILFQLVPILYFNDTSPSTSSNDSAAGGGNKVQTSNIDFLESKEDLYNKVLRDFSEKYERKIFIVKSLESLVQHQPLKPLIHDNISQLLKALQAVLNTFARSKEISGNEINKTVLMILLILIKEILESCCSSQEELLTNLYKPLKQLELQVHDTVLKFQIANLLKLIEDGAGSGSGAEYGSSSLNQFEEARSLFDATESYLQVEGIDIMIKLLKEKNEYALSNCHVLTALALETLKSPESYTFLSCVKLFVTLVSVNEEEVLELLADEYGNEAASMDYRLVVGEAILKVSTELGPLCYKYKSTLLNTFMSGCRSPVDEFRSSSFSNLSHMCRILTYQVHHFFQELLHLINCELTTGDYLPAKRAAVLVLSDLLIGMDNLFDYQEMLLPIYRLLKLLAASEELDEKMRLHASNGLSVLAEKCKELFRAALEQGPLEKQIQVVGIHDAASPKKSLKNHILEMN